MLLRLFMVIYTLFNAIMINFFTSVSMFSISTYKAQDMNYLSALHMANITERDRESIIYFETNILEFQEHRTMAIVFHQKKCHIEMHKVYLLIHVSLLCFISTISCSISHWLQTKVAYNLIRCPSNTKPLTNK